MHVHSDTDTRVTLKLYYVSKFGCSTTEMYRSLISFREPLFTATEELIAINVNISY